MLRPINTKTIYESPYARITVTKQQTPDTKSTTDVYLADLASVVEYITNTQFDLSTADKRHTAHLNYVEEMLPKLISGVQKFEQKMYVLRDKLIKNPDVKTPKKPLVFNFREAVGTDHLIVGRYVTKSNKPLDEDLLGTLQVVEIMTGVYKTRSVTFHTKAGMEELCKKVKEAFLLQNSVTVSATETPKSDTPTKQNVDTQPLVFPGKDLEEVLSKSSDYAQHPVNWDEIEALSLEVREGSLTKTLDHLHKKAWVASLIKNTIDEANATWNSPEAVNKRFAEMKKAIDEFNEFHKTTDIGLPNKSQGEQETPIGVLFTMFPDLK